MSHVLCPSLSDNKSDASLDYATIFSNEASDLGSFTTLSDSDSSSESDSKDKSESEDELALEDKDKHLPLEYYL